MILFSNTGPITVQNTLFEENYCSGDSSSTYAAGVMIVHVFNGPATFSNCTFLSNWADTAGAIGISVPTTGSHFTFSDCTFQNNSAFSNETGGGGTILIFYAEADFLQG